MYVYVYIYICIDIYMYIYIYISIYIRISFVCVTVFNMFPTMFKKMKDVASTRVNAAQNVADQQQLSFMKKRSLSGTASIDIYI